MELSLSFSSLRLRAAAERMSSAATFLDLPWEDVLFPQIFRHLGKKDLYNLRNVDVRCKEAVETYVSQMKTFVTQKEKGKIIKAILPLTRSLHTIILHRAKWLEDHDLHLIINLNKALQEVNIKKTKKLTICGLRAIHKVQGLKKITLNKISSIDDSFLIELAETQQDLVEIDFQDNKTKITEKGLIPLFLNCTGIKACKITIHNEISLRNLYEVTQRCKNLQSFDGKIER